MGPRYAHAEARKSPVVDGKVVRTADGKEQRFPVLLTPQVGTGGARLALDVWSMGGWSDWRHLLAPAGQGTAGKAR